MPKTKKHEIVKAEIVQPTVVHGRQERALTQSEIDLIQRTCARGTTPDQFAMFLWFCRKHSLDPIAKEIYCMLFNSKKHHQDFECPGPPTCGIGRGNESGIWHPGKDMAIVMGIGGLRGLAARHHADYGSTDEPEFTFSTQTTPAGKRIPESCTVRVWKKGAARPTSATLFWEEFAPLNLEDSRYDFWNRMPKNQLAKCTEAQALKKAYPDLANIYTTEEMARRMSQYTESGREIVELPRTGSHEAAQEIARQQLEKATQSDDPKIRALAEEGIRKMDSQGQRIIELDWSADEKSPILRGDIGDMIEVFKKELHMVWAGDWNHIEPRDAEKLRMLCEKHGYSLQEVLPNSSPAASEGKAKTGEAGRGKSKVKGDAAPPASPPVIVGEIAQATMTTKGGPRLTVLIKGKQGANVLQRVMTSWDQKHWKFLSEGVGKTAELYVTQRQKDGKTYLNIVGLKKIGEQEFDTDGKTPVIQRRDVKAGQRTLY